ncbi:MAG: TlpA family protein disulfide reductase [Betaproteobacteria bacterium]|nr:TlpA family protein disulfide reductase [Betaproteobacteria bacterium]
MPKIAFALAAVLVLALAGVAIGVARLDSGPAATADVPSAQSGASIGAIYATTFSDLDGKPVSLARWDQKLLVINFWATWCAPCREEMPLLSELQKKYAARNVQIIGIAADSTSAVADFSQKTPVAYPLLPAEGSAIEFSKRLGNRLGLLPHTVIIKPGGEVIYMKLGKVEAAEFERVIGPYLP